MLFPLASRIGAKWKTATSCQRHVDMLSFHVDMTASREAKSAPMLTFHPALMSTSFPGCQRAPTHVKYQTSL